jgi:hypothetical protein
LLDSENHLVRELGGHEIRVPIGIASAKIAYAFDGSKPKELGVALPASGRTVSIIQKSVDIDSGAISAPRAVERQRNVRARRDRGHHVQQSAVGECRYGHEVKHDLAAGAEWNRCLASGNPDDTIGPKGGDALGDPRRTSALKIPLDRVPSDVRIERPRRVILKLPLPGVDLVGTDLVALREVV